MEGRREGKKGGGKARRKEGRQEGKREGMMYIHTYTDIKEIFKKIISLHHAYRTVSNNCFVI